jgi:hypothetical protein
MGDALSVRFEALAGRYDDDDEDTPAPTAVDYAVDFPCAPAAAAFTAAAPPKATSELRRATPAETAAPQVGTPPPAGVDPHGGNATARASVRLCMCLLVALSWTDLDNCAEVGVRGSHAEYEAPTPTRSEETWRDQSFPSSPCRVGTLLVRVSSTAGDVLLSTHGCCHAPDDSSVRS